MCFEQVSSVPLNCVSDVSCPKVRVVEVSERLDSCIMAGVASSSHMESDLDADSGEELFFMSSDDDIADPLDTPLRHEHFDHSYAKDSQTPKRYKFLSVFLERARARAKKYRTWAWRLVHRVANAEDCLAIVRKEAESAPMRIIDGCFGPTFALLLEQKKQKKKGVVFYKISELLESYTFSICCLYVQVNIQKKSASWP